MHTSPIIHTCRNTIPVHTQSVDGVDVVIETFVGGVLQVLLLSWLGVDCVVTDMCAPFARCAHNDRTTRVGGVATQHTTTHMWLHALHMI